SGAARAHCRAAGILPRAASGLGPDGFGSNATSWIKASLRSTSSTCWSRIWRAPRRAHPQPGISPAHRPAGAGVRSPSAGDLIVAPAGGGLGVLVAGPWHGLGLLDIVSAVTRPFADP